MTERRQNRLDDETLVLGMPIAMLNANQDEDTKIHNGVYNYYSDVSNLLPFT